MIKPAEQRAVRIVADPDNPRGKVVYADSGELVPQLDHAIVYLTAGGEPTAQLRARVDQVLQPSRSHDVHAVDVVVGGECITWWGLECVPAVALLAELSRRDAHRLPPTAGEAIQRFMTEHKPDDPAAAHPPEVTG